MRLSILNYVARLSARPTRAENSVEWQNGSRSVVESGTRITLRRRIIGAAQHLCPADALRGQAPDQNSSTGERLTPSTLRSLARFSPKVATRRSQISLSILRKAASENSWGGTIFFLNRSTLASARLV